EQHRARDRGLLDRGLVKIRQLPHLGARERALEGVVGALDARNELGDVVVLRDPGGRNLLPLPVEAADKAHFSEQVLRLVGDEVENAVFLADLGGVHRLARAKYTRESDPSQGAEGIQPGQAGSRSACKTSELVRF